mmetsp:Transcript_39931/g.92639  ORF Transcript_39931/g.92639 Transcript_39931/m.92639 type:complete len:632 (-) Transcript_39931:193-2088(-)
MPDGATTLFDPPFLLVRLQHVAISTEWDRQLGVPWGWRAPCTAGLALVVPDFLAFGGDQRDSQAHAFRSPATTNPVDEVLYVIRQSHLDHKRQAGNVNTAGSNICANEETHVALFEGIQVSLAFLLLACTSQHHAGVRVLLPTFKLSSVALCAIQTIEVGFKVVAINVRAAKDKTLGHIESVCNLHDHLGLHDLDPLRRTQGFGVLLVKLRHARFGMHTVLDRLLRRVLCTGGDVFICPREITRRIDQVGNAVDCVGNSILALQVYPSCLDCDLADQFLDLRGMQRGTEEQRLNRVSTSSLDLGVQLQKVSTVVLLLQVVRLIKNKELDLGDIERLTAHKIHRLLQRAHNNVEAILERPRLLLLITSSHEQHGLEWWVNKVFAELHDALVSLLCKISSGLEDHAHWRASTLGLCCHLCHMLRVNLSDGCETINRILHGPVEPCHRRETLATQVRLQGSLTERGGQLEGTPQVQSVLAKRDDTLLPIEQTPYHIALLVGITVVLELSVRALLAGGAVAIALLVVAKLKLCTCSTPTDSCQTLNNLDLKHVFAFEDAKGTANSVPPPVVLALAFQAVCLHADQGVFVIQAELATKVRSRRFTHLAFATQALVDNLQTGQSKRTGLPAPCLRGH